MRIPPFEIVYRQYRDEIYGYMHARLPREDAADAFQETFLRALRTYEKLEHERELRAWLYTIARSVLADGARRAARRPVEVVACTGRESDHRASCDATVAALSDSGLAELTDELPATERAAVVLRYAFDMDYDDIGTALESSSDAARQATSAGVRRLRRNLDERGSSPGHRPESEPEVPNDTCSE
jgi:RNA polymerase sigma factor (sigma-70 family)